MTALSLIEPISGPEAVRFLRRTLVEAPRGKCLAITVAAPIGGAVENLLGCRSNRTVLWAAPGVSPVGGSGAFREIAASGPKRWGSLRRQAAAVFSKLSSKAQPGLRPCRPRFFGGVAFERGNWDGFPEASFVLPKWTYDRETGALTVVVETGRDSVEDTVRDYMRLTSALARRPTSPPRLRTRRLQSDTSTWARALDCALAHIDKGLLDKVVLARAVEVAAERAFDVGVTWRNLDTDDKWTTRFCFARDGKAFVGATPELLVRRVGPRVRSEALAGTAPQNEAAALMRSTKDLEEHKLVVEHVAARLEKVCASVLPPGKPSLRRLRGLVHLQTPIAATLLAPVHVLELAQTLHPTPAVGGTPYRAARAFIESHEGLARGWYAGAVGWFDAEGDGELRVALRSALVEGTRAKVFVGGGIVKGSKARAEFEETELKAQSMLTALGAT